MKAGEKSGFWTARLRSFAHAGRGIAVLIASQTNARIHLLATVAVISLGVFLRVTSADWCFLVFAMGLVWTAEAANTAIELLGDRVSHDHDGLIGRAKDVAAGAVLLSAITASVIGGLTLGPPIWQIFCGP